MFSLSVECLKCRHIELPLTRVCEKTPAFFTKYTQQENTCNPLCFFAKEEDAIYNWQQPTSNIFQHIR